MAVTLINPDGLPKPDVYRQMSIATGSKLVFLAGQVARDAEGGRVGEGDLAAQVEQSYLNIGTALAAVGGSFDDVAKLTVYVVDWTPDKMPLLGEGSLGRPRSWGSTRSSRSHCWVLRHWGSPIFWSRLKPPRSSTESGVLDTLAGFPCRRAWSPGKPPAWPNGRGSDQRPSVRERRRRHLPMTWWAGRWSNASRAVAKGVTPSATASSSRGVRATRVPPCGRCREAVPPRGR
ncbi:RidA family protein [Streptosporangium lutulentum]